jgi:hypothetical protein
MSSLDSESSEFLPLGLHCNISLLMKSLKIKHTTTLFEWFEFTQLQFITDIINVIKDGVDTTIIKNNPACSESCVYILHESVHCHHYKLEDYVTIFQRRANRFLQKIKNSSRLLFARINVIGHITTEEEINNFCDSIHSINPNIHIKFLLINTVNDESSVTPLDVSKIRDATLFERFFLLADCLYDWYLIDNPVLKQKFIDYLLETGYTPIEGTEPVDHLNQ